MNIVPTALRTAANLSLRLSDTAPRAAQLEKELAPHAPDELLLKVDPSLTAEQVKELAADYGATVKQEFTIPDNMKAAFNGKLLLLETGPGITEFQALAALTGDERVKIAAPNDDLQLVEPRHLAHTDGEPQPDPRPPAGPDEKLPNDLHLDQWSLRNANVPGGKEGADISAGKAWAVTTGGGKTGPLVAVIDSGIDAFHEDLKANIWQNPTEIDDDKDNDNDGFIDDVHGLNAVDGTGNIIDEVGHGTHVAGIIGAVGDNGVGIAGINWNTQMMGVKISDGERVSLVAAISGTLYATQHGARIANHSWGGTARNPILEDVMKSSPMLHVCAAGNAQSDSDQHPFYPAGFDAPNIISVGASTRDDEALFFSNWGANTVDVHAPGARVYSTLPVHKYDELSGTSMAAPHVSGVAALVVSKFPDISNAELKDRLMFSSDPMESMRTLSVSGGRLNAFKALEDDTVAPGEISEFQVDKSRADGFTVSWNGVGDDGMTGTTARYELSADFGDRQERLIPQFPKGPGEKETYTYRAFPRDHERPFTLKLDAVDNVGNRSSVVTAQGTIPKAELPLAADFDGEDNWTVDGTWAKVPEEGRGLVYTDSPAGAHVPGSKTSLTSPTFSLKDLKNSILTFDAKMVTNEYDFIFVETSADGGEGWKNLTVLRRDKTPGYGEWGSYQFDLSQYDGADNLKVRFKYEPGNQSKEDGVWIDNVKVMAAKDAESPVGV